MVEGITDYGIVMLDPAGRVISWNAGAQRIKGYTADEIIGQHFSRFYTREDIERGVPQRALDAATTSGRCEDEGWLVRKDGSTFWARRVLTAILDQAGNLRGYASVTRDQTQHRQVESAMANAKAGGGKKQPCECGFSDQHEPRVARFAQRDTRFRPADGIRYAAADAGAEGKHSQDSAGRLVSDGTDQLDPRSGGHRVRASVVVAGTDVAGRRDDRMPGRHRTAGAKERHPHDLSQGRQPVLYQGRSRAGETGAHQPSVQCDQVQPAGRIRRRGMQRKRAATRARQRHGHRRRNDPGEARAVVPAVRPCRAGEQR